MEMEDRLAAAFADVHHHPIVLETGIPRGRGDEVEHPLRLVRRELVDLPKARHVALGDDEEVGVGSGIDVADRDEPVGLRDMVAFRDEPAEQTVLRQRGSPPRRPKRREP